MKVQRATYTTRYAKLSTEFGEKMARRWFTADQLALVPLKKAGKNKGKMGGTIVWLDCTVGGWCKQRGVVLPGTRDVRIIWHYREYGMTREADMPSRGRVEDVAA